MPRHVLDVSAQVYMACVRGNVSSLLGSRPEMLETRLRLLNTERESESGVDELGPR